MFEGMRHQRPSTTLELPTLAFWCVCNTANTYATRVSTWVFPCLTMLPSYLRSILGGCHIARAGSLHYQPVYLGVAGTYGP